MSIVFIRYASSDMIGLLALMLLGISNSAFIA